MAINAVLNGSTGEVLVCFWLRAELQSCLSLQRCVSCPSKVPRSQSKHHGVKVAEQVNASEFGISIIYPSICHLYLVMTQAQQPLFSRSGAVFCDSLFVVLQDRSVLQTSTRDQGCHWSERQLGLDLEYGQTQSMAVHGNSLSCSQDHAASMRQTGEEGWASSYR